MTVVLGKEQILHCFDALNQKLAEHGQYGEILVCGGASMALLFDDTTITKDIDAVILSTEMKNDISKYAAEIAEEQLLDEDWFNEAAKGYINLTWKREEVSKYSNLAVYSVPAEQLLAMKLSAARTDARDMEDAIKLMGHLGLQQVEEALEILEKNMPGIILTAKNEFFACEAFEEYKEREKAMEKRRLFIDMDGTLAVFTPVETMETLYEEGYFLNQEPHETVIKGVKQFIDENSDVEVFVMSSVLSDSSYALLEKQEWLNKYLPEIDEKHRIFPPCGQDKADFVPGGIRDTDVLLDDYSQNLHQWEPPAIGVKLMNGINGTKGSWQGRKLEYSLAPRDFAQVLKNAVEQMLEVTGEMSRKMQSEIRNQDLLTKAGNKNIEEHWQSFVGHIISNPAAELIFYSYDNGQFTVRHCCGNPDDYLESKGTPEEIAEQYHFDGDFREKFFDMDYKMDEIEKLPVDVYEKGKELFSKMSYDEQFKTILENEFPETVGNRELQVGLYHTFISSYHTSLFGNDLWKEIAREIPKLKKQIAMGKEHEKDWYLE